MSNHSALKLDNANPFPGLNSYTESSKKFFFGRNAEVKALFNLINRNRLTILLGKSGIGKTSLIQAGIVPLLKENRYLPIYIQCKLVSEYTQAPLIKVKEEIGNIVKKMDENTISIENLTLWEYFQSLKIFGGIVTPLIIFDHFEEIFKIGKKKPSEINPLIRELGDLVENWIPSEIINSSKNENFLNTDNQAKYRVLLSIREDFFSQLLNLRRVIPSVVNGNYHYKVTQLKGRNAVNVIAKAGDLVIENENVAREIVRRLPESKELEYIPGSCESDNIEEKWIAPFLLNLFCYQLNENRKISNFKKISSDFVKEIIIEDVVEEFYNETISGFDSNVGEAIETELVTEDGERKLQDVSRIKSNYGLSDDELEKLVNKRILRKEVIHGLEYAELIHDVLSPIVLKRRVARLIEKDREKRLKKVVSRLVGIFSAVIIILSIYSFLDIKAEENKVKELKAASDSVLMLNNDNTEAMRLALSAYEMNNPPQDRTSQTLVAVGNSSYVEPFYVAKVRHDGPVTVGSFSPVSNSFLTASYDSTAKIFDADGEEKVTLQHEGRILFAEYSHDGKMILTVSSDNAAYLWDSDGKLIKRLQHENLIDCIQFSNNNKWFLTASRGGVARLWNLEGELVRKFRHGKMAISSAVFSSDDKFLLTASWDHDVKLWDIENENPIVTINTAASVNTVAFSPDDKKILCGTWGKKAFLYDLSGKEIMQLSHESAVEFAFFLPDDNGIITASRDGEIKRWSVESGKFLAKFKHSGEITSIDYYNEKLLTSSKDRTVKMWDLEGRQLLDLNKFDCIVHQASFSPDGKKIITADDNNTAIIWDLGTNFVVDLHKHTDDVRGAKFSPDGQYIVTASSDGTAKVWNIDGNLISDLKKHRGSINTAEFSPGGDWIVTASDDRTAKLWERKNNGHFEYKESIRHAGPVNSAFFSPGGELIVTASSDTTAKIWGLDGVRRKTLSHPNGAVRFAIFSPDGKTILTMSVDRIVRIWDWENEKELAALEHSGNISSAVFSPDSTMVLTAVENGEVSLWSAANGEKKKTLQHKKTVTRAIFNNNGDLILTASLDGVVRFFDIAGNKKDVELRHRMGVTFVEFSKNDEYIATTSLDRTASLWNTDGMLLATLRGHKEDINRVRFSPDGDRLVTASKDGLARIYLTPWAVYEFLKKKSWINIGEKKK